MDVEWCPMKTVPRILHNSTDVWLELTEQSAKNTVHCERARHMLPQHPAIDPRLTLEQLEDCYGIWDRFSEYKVRQSWLLLASQINIDTKIKVRIPHCDYIKIGVLT